MTEPTTEKTLYLIDGYAQIFRAYYAIRSLSAPSGEPTNATFGFVGMLLKLLRDYQPDYIAMAIDVSGDTETFRSTIYPEYKKNREAPPEDFGPQVDRILEISSLMGIPVLGVEGFEADDVIATLCTQLADEGIRVRIVSKDKDLMQLLNERIELFDVHTDTAITIADLMSEQGISPAQVIDALALMGDNVDNIPGVPGIGKKTAAKLIAKYGSLENLLAHTDELTPKQRENVEAYADKLPLNLDLVRLRHDVPLDFTLDQAIADPAALPVDQLRDIFKQLNFNRHVTDLEKVAGVEPSDASASSSDAAGQAKKAAAARRRQQAADADGPGLFGSMAEQDADADEGAGGAGGLFGSSFDRADPALYQLISTEAELADYVKTLETHTASGGIIAVDTETTALGPMHSQLCGICLAHQPRQGVYIPVLAPEGETHLDPATALDALRPLLESPDILKCGHNLKYDIAVFRRAGLRLRGAAFDTMVASYLLDATRSSHSLANLALAFLDYEMLPISDLIGSGKVQRSFATVPLADATTYAAEDADITLRLYELLAPQIREQGMSHLADDLEMPLVTVLADLEYNGILVDPDELDRQRDAAELRIIALREQIQNAAIEANPEIGPFSPDSPKQLAEVLFNGLNCRVVKRNKTGPSTDAEVLQRMADEQPPPCSVIAELLLEYRQNTKLVSTYFTALKEAIHPETHRIHASFNQTGTATGRLSSNGPNLQNIPIRTELGREIRKAFIAAPGHVLLAADYSQIELRMLAHLSGDPRLIEAFEQGMDIHNAVAAQVFGIEPEAVTREQRGVAKMVNFGIVYGITPYGLARRLGPGVAPEGLDPVKYATQIITDYKARYTGIDTFLNQCVAYATTHGYVTTIAGRRRAVEEVTSRNGQQRQLGERIAINTVVQGSAADLIKQAMVRLHRRIEQDDLPMKMLLQIHDELVCEVPADQAQAMATILTEEMTTAMNLKVPLKVDVDWGKSWYESK